MQWIVIIILFFAPPTAAVYAQLHKVVRDVAHFPFPGHLESKSSIKRVLAITAVLALVYSVSQVNHHTFYWDVTQRT